MAWNYNIKCRECGGDTFNVSITKYSHSYIAHCANPECDDGDCYMVGGKWVPTQDDKYLRRKAILARRYA